MNQEIALIVQRCPIQAILIVGLYLKLVDEHVIIDAILVVEVTIELRILYLYTKMFVGIF